MSEWKRVRLGDIFDLQMGKTPDRKKLNYFKGTHKWISIADISKSGKYISETKEYLSDEAISSSGIKPIPQNTLIMSFKLSIGKAAITSESMYSNEAIMAFIPNGKYEVNNNFLYYLFSNKNWSEGSNKAVKGITLNKASLSEAQIPLPPLEEQKRIAAILDKCTEIIAKRKAQFSALDELVKARFVEMFGDPVQNPKGWDEVNISTVLRGKASNGFFAKREDYLSDGNVSILGVAYIVNRMYSQIDNLPRTNASLDDIQKFSVQYGDMLFCRSSLVAEGIGKASIVPKNTPKNILFECHVIRLPLDLEKCIPEFLQVLSTTDYFRRQMIAQSKTATMTTIGQEGILKATIILPPMDKQKNFYVFVSHINKMKLTIQKALEQSQLLFDSLMQEYFG